MTTLEIVAIIWLVIVIIGLIVLVMSTRGGSIGDFLDDD